MAASVTSPADVVNQALQRIGQPLRVGSLYDGSMPAKNALVIYGQTRDELLRQDDWGFAERNIQLTALKWAPLNGYVPPNVWTPMSCPPLPWLWEYAYPADCIKVRCIKQAPLFNASPDPMPNVFRIVNDNALVPPQRVIVTNVANAVCVYSAQVTDPATWDAGFVEALVASLARRLSASLALLDQGKAEALKDEGADEQSSVGRATMIQG